MGKEIERKFLVDMDKIDFSLAKQKFNIKQGYIQNTIDSVVRVRLSDQIAFLSIKGNNKGTTRDEFEYQIPPQDANEMLKLFCDKKIEKERFIFDENSHIWEVDVFEGENRGLVIAEIELNSETEDFIKPDWILEEVTHDVKFLNSRLLDNPYKNWVRK